MKVNDDNDFGFTMLSEEEAQAEPTNELTKLQADFMKVELEKRTLAAHNKELLDRLKRTEEMVMPLIINLRKKPEKEMIKWPNRVDRLNKFEADLKKIIHGE